MADAFLTRCQARNDDRRTATLMLAMVLALATGVRSARADDDVAPPSLISRALRLRRCEDQDRSAAAATAHWLPRLRVRAIVERSGGPLSHDNTMVLGELAWPLGRGVTGDAVMADRTRRLTSADRERLVDRIADAWRRRRQLGDARDELDATLDAEEAEAELDALTGRDEGGP